MRAPARYLIVLALLGPSASAAAQDDGDRVVLHGYGSWTYGNTNRNHYLGGQPQGDYHHVSSGLNLSSVVEKKFTVHVQTEIRADDDGTHPSLNYAFIERRLSDRFAVRIGKVKHPFGIYTEVFPIGTLRPFLDLPQGLYGPIGFAGQAYLGVGLTGTMDTGRWTIAYDLYGGGIDLDKFPLPDLFYHGEPIEEFSGEIQRESTRDVVGAHVVARTPIHGFSFGASAFTGIHEEAEHAGRRTVLAGQLEYRSNTLAMQAEVAHQNHVGDERVTGGYVQAAYRLVPAWQVGVQYSYIKSSFDGVDPSAAPSLQRHEEGAVVASYWISRSLVLKAEYHRVSGNRLALPEPEDFLVDIANGRLRTITNLIVVGSQFSF